MKNSIVNIKTIPVRGNNGSCYAIMIGVDIVDPSQLEPISRELVENFTSQMMLSPEETHMMLITVIGDCTAEQLKSHWTSLVKNDPVLEYFMSKMEKADIMHGTPEGKVIDQVSILSP